MNFPQAERTAILAGLVPCFRCRAVYDTEGELAGHLRNEHLMADGQAMQEAHEATTGITRDGDGRCKGCYRSEVQGHAPKCYVAKRAERLGYQKGRDS